ncbi:MAG: DNA-formamidopyrimidine glycosylase family protein [Candidatus Roizmanbacteria bacterium]
MPEGDKVLRETRFLQKLLAGKHFIYISTCRDLSPTFDLGELCSAADKPVHVFCKGKQFYFTFANEVTLMFHHMMGGYWSQEETKHSILCMTFTDELKVYYNKQRFSKITFLADNVALQKSLRKITDGFIGDYLLDKETWLKKCKRFRADKSVRVTLLDQGELCSGLGNYLVAEIMYFACIYPTAQFGDLNQDELINLYDVALELVTDFYEQRIDQVIYKQKVCPLGYPIRTLNVYNRTAHYVPEVQLIGVR